jgi:hypothetical protein
MNNVLDYGTYIVQVESIFVGNTKTTNRPCVSIKYVVADGEHEGAVLYQTQLLTTAYGVKCACNLFASMDCLNKDMLSEASVENREPLRHCAYQIYQHREEVAYELEYSVNSKGYNEYKITGVFDIADDEECEEDTAPAAVSTPATDMDEDSNESDDSDELPFPDEDDDDLLPF